MEIEAAKLIAAGLATMGIGLSAVGIGVVYAMAPEAARGAGLLFTAGLGAVCLLVVFMLLFVY